MSQGGLCCLQWCWVLSLRLCLLYSLQGCWVLSLRKVFVVLSAVVLVLSLWESVLCSTLLGCCSFLFSRVFLSPGVLTSSPAGLRRPCRQHPEFLLCSLRPVLPRWDEDPPAQAWSGEPTSWLPRRPLTLGSWKTSNPIKAQRLGKGAGVGPALQSAAQDLPVPPAVRPPAWQSSAQRRSLTSAPRTSLR